MISWLDKLYKLLNSCLYLVFNQLTSSHSSVGMPTESSILLNCFTHFLVAFTKNCSIFPIDNNVTTPRLEDKIVRFLLAKWLLAFLIVIQYNKEHDQDGVSMIKVYWLVWSPVHVSCECECGMNVDVTNSHNQLTCAQLLQNNSAKTDLLCQNSYSCIRRHSQEACTGI